MVHTEELLLKWIPKMRDGVSEDLKNDFSEYLVESQEQLKRAQAIVLLFKIPSREKKSEGMMGLLLRVQQLILRVGKGPTLDAAMIALRTKIMTHNQVSYENLEHWAKALGYDETSSELELMAEVEKKSRNRAKPLQRKCDMQAASQLFDSPLRKERATKRLKEPVERWGDR